MSFNRWRSLVDGTEVDVGPAIPDSVLYQYDAQTLDLSDGDPVTTWEDALDNRDLTEGDGATFESDGINGNQSVAFDGVDDYLAWDGEHSFGRELAVIAVIEHTDERHTYSMRDPSDDVTSIIIRQHEDDYFLWADDGTEETAAKTVDTDPAIETLRITDNGDMDIEVRRNGSEETTITHSGDSFSDVRLAVGADWDGEFNWEGAIGELVIYESLTESERDDEEQRLSDKWGISID